MLNLGTDLQRVVKFIVALLKTLLALSRKREFDKIGAILEDADEVVRTLETTVSRLMPPTTEKPPALNFANFGKILKWLGKNYSLILFVVWSAGDITQDFREQADELAKKWGIVYK